MESTYKHPDVQKNDLQNLAKSGGWMQFISILFMIFIGFFLIGMIFIGFAIMASKGNAKLPLLNMAYYAPVIFFLIVIAISAVFLYQFICLLRAASAAKSLNQGNANAGLTKYAKNYKNYLMISVFVGALGVMFTIFNLFASL